MLQCERAEFIYFNFYIFFLHITGNYQKALETYKDIHRRFPENVECNSSCLLQFSAELLTNNRWCPGQCKDNESVCMCVCFGCRPAFLGAAVHRYGIEGSSRVRHKAEEGGEDEGNQRTGTSEFYIY